MTDAEIALVIVMMAIFVAVVSFWAWQQGKG